MDNGAEGGGTFTWNQPRPPSTAKPSGSGPRPRPKAQAQYMNAQIPQNTAIPYPGLRSFLQSRGLVPASGAFSARPSSAIRDRPQSGAGAMAGTVIQGTRPKTPSQSQHDATKIAASIYLAKSSTSATVRKASARQPSPGYAQRPGTSSGSDGGVPRRATSAPRTATSATYDRKASSSTPRAGTASTHPDPYHRSWTSAAGNSSSLSTALGFLQYNGGVVAAGRSSVVGKSPVRGQVTNAWGSRPSTRDENAQRAAGLGATAQQSMAPTAASSHPQPRKSDDEPYVTAHVAIQGSVQNPYEGTAALRAALERRVGSNLSASSAMGNGSDTQPGTTPQPTPPKGTASAGYAGMKPRPPSAARQRDPSSTTTGSSPRHPPRGSYLLAGAGPAVLTTAPESARVERPTAARSSELMDASTAPRAAVASSAALEGPSQARDKDRSSAASIERPSTASGPPGIPPPSAAHHGPAAAFVSILAASAPHAGQPPAHPSQPPPSVASKTQPPAFSDRDAGPQQPPSTSSSSSSAAAAAVKATASGKPVPAEALVPSTLPRPSSAFRSASAPRSGTDRDHAASTPTSASTLRPQSAARREVGATSTSGIMPTPTQTASARPPSAIPSSRGASSNQLVTYTSREPSSERNPQPSASSSQPAAQSSRPSSSNSSTVGGYTIGRVLGEGGFCQVRQAVHHISGVKVAIKVVDKSKLTGPNDKKRMAREIAVMKRLNHGHIIRCFDVIEAPTRTYIVMEYATSGSLLDYVRARKRLGESEASNFLQQMASGLLYCHLNNVIHRDVKLENVLLDASNLVKLIDFGLCAIAAPGTKLKVFCGSPSYAAPEIVSRKPYEGAPVDVWSLGVVLFAMVCGFLPFHAQGDKKALCRKIIKGQFTIPDHVSPDLQDLLRRMLTVDPTERLPMSAVLTHPWVLRYPSNKVRPPTADYHAPKGALGYVAGTGVFQSGRPVFLGTEDSESGEVQEGEGGGSAKGTPAANGLSNGVSGSRVASATVSIREPSMKEVDLTEASGSWAVGDSASSNGNGHGHAHGANGTWSLSNLTNTTAQPRVKSSARKALESGREGGARVLKLVTDAGITLAINERVLAKVVDSTSTPREVVLDLLQADERNSVTSAYWLLLAQFEGQAK